MSSERQGRLTAAEVLQKYSDDHLPEFLDRAVEDVNQVGITGDRPIHIACVRGNLDDVIALVEGGADVNAAGDLGYRPLHHAASRGLSDIARVLLGHRADLTVKNEFGQTPMDVARLMKKHAVLEVLESATRARS